MTRFLLQNQHTFVAAPSNLPVEIVEKRPLVNMVETHKTKLAELQVRKPLHAPIFPIPVKTTILL